MLQHQKVVCPPTWRPRAEPVSLVTRRGVRPTKPMPVPSKQRVVPAFSVQSLRPDAVVNRAPRAGVHRPRPTTGPTRFRMFYRRGDLPVDVPTHGRRQLTWRVDLGAIDYHHFLPLFFEGLCETDHPYRFIAVEGVNDLLVNGADRILPCVPQLIVPLRRALDSRDRRVIATTLRALQLLVRCDPRVGEILVPYFRQLLPVCNLFFQDGCRGGNQIGRAESTEAPLGTVIQDTLNLLEKYGGEDAYINIKYMVPNYQSCIHF